MREPINHIVFGWYPYLCLTVFLLGSLLRFDREQYTWQTRLQPAAAPAPADVGLEPVPCRHPRDLRRPLRRPADADLGVRRARHLATASSRCWRSCVGGIAGIFCLDRHRAADASAAVRCAHPHAPRRSATSRSCCMLFAQLLLGLATIPVSMGHLDGHEMVKFMNWAQGILHAAARRVGRWSPTSARSSRRICSSA